MRASEFSNATVEDSSLIKTHLPDVKLHVSKDGAMVKVRAYAVDPEQPVDYDNQIGYAVFERDGKNLVSLSVSVDHAWRRRGIATAMYDHVKSLGFTIHPSKDQLTGGERLWARRVAQAKDRVATWESHAPTPETIEIFVGRRERITTPAPRYVYHSLRGRKLSSDGSILGYPLSLRERELEDDFKEPSRDGYVWLSPRPYTSEAMKIDAAKLDPRNLRYTGQVEGNLIHRGSIPAEAIVGSSEISEGASGYIPSNAEKNDPRYKTALTIDIKPDTMKKNARKFGWKIRRDGTPPLLRN